MRLRSLATNLSRGSVCRKANAHRGPLPPMRLIGGLVRRFIKPILIFALAVGLPAMSPPAIAIPFTVTFEEVGPVQLPGVNPATIGPFTFTPGALVLTLAGPNELGFNRDRWSSSPSNVASLGPNLGFAMYLTAGGEFDFLAAHFANSHPTGLAITVLGYSRGQVTHQTEVCGLACFIPQGGSGLDPL